MALHIEDYALIGACKAAAGAACGTGITVIAGCATNSGAPRRTETVRLGAMNDASACYRLKAAAAQLGSLFDCWMGLLGTASAV
jgi:hypothetical protein